MLWPLVLIGVYHLIGFVGVSFCLGYAYIPRKTVWSIKHLRRAWREDPILYGIITIIWLPALLILGVRGLWYRLRPAETEGP